MLRRRRVTRKGWAQRPAPLSWPALLAFVLAILCLLALALSGPGVQWGWWHFRFGFSLLRWAAYGGIAAALLALFGLVHARPATGRRGLTLAGLALLIGLTVAIVPWLWQRHARTVPPIHDITTDTQNPPQFSAILPLRADAPNPPEYQGEEVAAQQRAAYPDIRPLRVDSPPIIAMQRAQRAAESLRWEIVDVDEEAGRIEAIDRTFWFGFVDDVVIRVTELEQGSRIDIRSKSRVGRSDVGANARRIRRFLDRMEGR
jgi:uncharacterized protein (DUF1499 family)